jgi:hypothetical protein
MPTYLHEIPGGGLAEYRRVHRTPTVLDLESRLLLPNGQPYDDQWWPVTDSQLLAIQKVGSDIVQLLAAE